MAVTAIADIIVPEVLADQIAAKFPEQLVLGNSSIVQVDGNFNMPGGPGTTFTIPFWKKIASFAALSEGVAMTPNKITAGKEQTTVQRAGAAYEVYDTAQLSTMADPVGEISTQIARRAAEYIDSKLVAALEKTPNTADVTAAGDGKLDQNDIANSVVNTLGDQHQLMLGRGRIIMHSKPYGDLLQLGAIQNQYQSGMDVMKSGTIPMLMGLPVFVSDRVTVTTVSGVPQYKTYIAGPDALGLFFQRNVKVEFDRDILLQADVIAATVHFAAHLFGWDDVGNALAAESAKSVLAVAITSK
jgi:hypothetical protein